MMRWMGVETGQVWIRTKDRKQCRVEAIQVNLKTHRCRAVLRIEGQFVGEYAAITKSGMRGFLRAPAPEAQPNRVQP